MSKLKPCPICGLEPEMEPWHGSGLNSTRIGCNPDFCPVGVGVVRPSQRGAIKAWNTRPIEDALRAEVERLKAEGMKALQAAAETGELAMSLTAEVAALKAELAGCQEANHAVAVCRNHTNDIITRDGCVICDLARYTAPLTDEQAAKVQPDYPSQAKHWDAAIRRARRGE